MLLVARSATRENKQSAKGKKDSDNNFVHRSPIDCERPNARGCFGRRKRHGSRGRCTRRNTQRRRREDAGCSRRKTGAQNIRAAAEVVSRYRADHRGSRRSGSNRESGGRRAKPEGRRTSRRRIRVHRCKKAMFFAVQTRRKVKRVQIARTSRRGSRESEEELPQTRIRDGLAGPVKKLAKEPNVFGS